jgi:hypothetical protein
MLKYKYLDRDITYSCMYLNVFLNNFRHKTSQIILSIIFLEDKHKMLLHLSIFYEYQQFFQHRICFMYVSECFFKQHY